MDLTEKLVIAGKEQLSVSILFMLAQNPGVSEIHPRLQELSWSSLVKLSEKKQDPREEHKTSSSATDFENFIP